MKVECAFRLSQRKPNRELGRARGTGLVPKSQLEFERRM